MKVLLTMYGEEELKRVASPEDIARTMRAWGEFGAAAQEAGVFVVCDALEGSHAATTVRVRGDERQVTDGPFIETKEQLGGVIILEVADLDEAMVWAERTPWNEDGCVTEIRPIMDYDAYAARAGLDPEEAQTS
jgi:hypothetical protein